MIPWENLARATAPGGSELTLHRRGHEYVIRVDGRDLMGSRQHGSEESLAELTCSPLAGRAQPRVLIGGLGMGFTARAALDVLGPGALVEIAELVPEVVAWNRGILAPLAGAPLSDARVRVHETDVVALIRQSRASFDAILLDVDNGPEAFTSPANARLYGPTGLGHIWAALRPGGTLAVWSAAPSPKFTARLERTGFRVRVESVPARHGGVSKGRKRHVIWLAQRGD